jgi:hypothetical protein
MSNLGSAVLASKDQPSANEVSTPVDQFWSVLRTNEVSTKNQVRHNVSLRSTLTAGSDFLVQRSFVSRFVSRFAQPSLSFGPSGSRVLTSGLVDRT